MSCVSVFGLRKIMAARASGDRGEYAGRLLALVRLVDARPHAALVTDEWPPELRRPRSELVVACLDWCRAKLMPDGSHLLAARVLLTVALPQARRLAVVTRASEHDVLRALAECLAELQVRAFLKWETRGIGGDMGARLLEWAIRARRFLGLPRDREEGLQLLHLPAANTSLRQAQLRAARARFLKIGDAARVEQVDGLLLPLSDGAVKFPHSPVEPLSACAELPHIRARYHPPDLETYYADVLARSE